MSCFCLFEQQTEIRTKWLHMIARLKSVSFLAALVWLLAGSVLPSQAEEIQAITTPSADVTLSFVVPGRLSKVLVKEGDLVKRNQLLARLDDKPERIQAQQFKVQAGDMSRIKAAEAELAQKKVDLEKVELAKTKGAASDWEIEHLRLGVRIAEFSLEAAILEQQQYRRRYEQAVSQLERMRLVAPIAGQVEKVVVEAGEAVKTLGPVIQLVNIDPLWIDVPVPLPQANELSMGQEVPVTFPGTDSVTSFNGRIIHVSSVADAASDTLRVRVEVPNPHGRPAGERVTVGFPQSKDQLSIVREGEQAPFRANLHQMEETQSAETEPVQQDHIEGETVSEERPLDVLENQEAKHRDSRGEVYLGKIMTLNYPAYTREPDQRYEHLLTQLSHSLKMPKRINYRVVIKGYTDNSGSQLENHRISLQRAERLRKLLVHDPRMAMSEGRITAEGYGPFNPVASNQSAEGRAQNRRVEIHIYGDAGEGLEFTD